MWSIYVKFIRIITARITLRFLIKSFTKINPSKPTLLLIFASRFAIMYKYNRILRSCDSSDISVIQSEDPESPRNSLEQSASSPTSHLIPNSIPMELTQSEDPESSSNSHADIFEGCEYDSMANTEMDEAFAVPDQVSYSGRSSCSTVSFSKLKKKNKNFYATDFRRGGNNSKFSSCGNPKS